MARPFRMGRAEWKGAILRWPLPGGFVAAKMADMRYVFAALALCCVTDPVAAQSQTPDGYYASGWPIALAEAACGPDNEGCLTLLANCGPGASCPDTVALCAYDPGGSATTAPLRPCTLHKAKRRQIVVAFPDRAETLRVKQHPERFNGKRARINGALETGQACWHVNDKPVLCLRPLRTAEDIAPWAPKK